MEIMNGEFFCKWLVLKLMHREFRWIETHVSKYKSTDCILEHKINSTNYKTMEIIWNVLPYHNGLDIENIKIRDS